jgi:hypothetical protein
VTDTGDEAQLDRQELELDDELAGLDAMIVLSREVDDECACRAMRIGPADKPQTLDGITHDYWVCHHADEGP